MTEPFTNERAEAVVELPAELNLPVAAELKDMLANAAARCERLVLDAGQVERITTPCVQVIVSLSNTMRESGGALKVSEASEAFTTALTLLGFKDTLDGWMERAARADTF